MKSIITIIFILACSYGAYSIIISITNEGNKKGISVESNAKLNFSLGTQKKSEKILSAVIAKALPSNKNLNFKDIIEKIEANDNESIKKAIESNPDLINYTDSLGRLLINEVIKRNNIELTDYLLSKSVQLNTVDIEGFSPLMETVKVNSKDSFEKLISNGAVINLKNDQGRDVLITAVEYTKADFVELALQNGANPDTTFTDLSLTPIMMASINDTPEMIKILKNHNASLNLKDNNGRNSLHHAAMEANIEVMKELISLGIENSSDDLGKKPLDYAKENNDYDVISILEEL